MRKSAIRKRIPLALDNPWSRPPSRAGRADPKTGIVVRKSAIRKRIPLALDNP